MRKPLIAASLLVAAVCALLGVRVPDAAASPACPGYMGPLCRETTECVYLGPGSSCTTKYYYPWFNDQ